MPRFRIQGLDKSVLGYVHGNNKGAALQAAVDKKLVTGRKKIFSATPVADNDPYEQTTADIFGAAKKQKRFRFYKNPHANAWPASNVAANA